MNEPARGASSGRPHRLGLAAAATIVVASLAAALVVHASLDVQVRAEPSAPGSLGNWEWHYPGVAPAPGAATLPSGELLAVSGRIALIARGSRLEEWDRVTFERVASHALRGEALAADPQGRRVLVRSTAGRRPSFAVVDVATGRTLSHPALGLDHAPRFAPDGAHFVTQSGANDRVITWWDAGSGRAVAKRAAATATVLGFTADSRQVLLGTSSFVILWTPASGREVLVAALGTGVTADAAAITADGARLITAGSDDLLKEWDIRSHAEIRTLGTQPATRDMTLGPGGRLVAVGWWDTIAVWDHAAGTKVVELADGTDLGLRRAYFSPDGTQVLGQGRYGDVFVWDVRGPEPNQFAMSRILPGSRIQRAGR